MDCYNNTDNLSYIGAGWEKPRLTKEESELRRIGQKCLALIMALAMAFTCMVPAFAAGEQYQVELDVTYSQTEARTMLELVNAFRTSGDAWYYGKPNDEGFEEKVPVTDLQPLQYDYKLEKVAMQRAAEIAIHFAHTRPDGTECWTAYEEVGSFGNQAENIAAGRITAAATFDQWKEENEPYAGQGHRRNMLSSSVTTFAIGHVVYDGYHFWVQEFGSNRLGTEEIAANDSLTTVTVTVGGDLIASKSAEKLQPLTMQVGGTADLPTVMVDMEMTETWGSSPQVETRGIWNADEAGVVAVDGTALTALKVGTTKLTGTAMGVPVELGITVTAASLEGAEIVLSGTSFSATGEEIKPAVTVSLNGQTLQENIDFTVSYSNNIEPGTATVTVTGIGNYTGMASTNFEIAECSHEWGEGEETTTPTCSDPGVRTYTCSLCGATKKETIEPLGHNWDSGKVTKEPTCTQEGVRTYTCIRCQQTKEDPIEKKEHTPEVIPGTPASCTKPGLTEGSRCSVCQTILAEQTEIPALGHRFGEWETVNSATCTGAGSQQRTCTACGYTETQGLEPTGHAWAEAPTVDKQPTCTEDGSQSIHCTKCDATKDSETIPMLGHDWDEGTVTKEATCTEAGEKTYTCSRCSETKTEESPALDHDWDEGAVTKEATCTETGEKTYTCSRCSETKTEEIPALDHDWGEGSVTKEPACTEAGEKTYTCGRCGETKTEEIPALGHDWDEGVVTKEPTCTETGEKMTTCKRCQAEETQLIAATGHTEETLPEKTATCTEPGLTEGTRCSVCQQILVEQEEIPALGHAWDEGTVTTPATCTEPGVKTYTCTRCGETKTDTLPATGHAYSDTWSSDEDGHWHACTVCGDRKDEAGHTWQWVVDRQPTATVNGKRHQECTVCKYKGKEETLPCVLEKPDIPGAEEDEEYRIEVRDVQSTDDKTALTRTAAQKLPENVASYTTTFYDLVLQVNEGGEWQNIVMNAGITVVLPYPSGTNARNYDFIVAHKKGDNSIELPSVTETDTGLRVTFQGLSPVSVTAYQVKTEDAPTEQPTEKPQPDPVTPPVAPEQTTKPASAEPTAAPQTENEPTPAPTPAPTAAPSSAPAGVPATGDSFPLGLWIALFAVGGCGLIALTVIVLRRRDR